MNERSALMGDPCYKPIPKKDNIYSEVDPKSNTQIYPGINPITNTQNQISSEAFVNVYPKLTQWIASNNLEAYLNDHNNTLIQRKDQLTTQIEETRNNIISSLYTSKRAQAHLKFYEEFTTNWKNQSIDVYIYYNIAIPNLVLAGYNSPNKARAKEFNKLAPKKMLKF